MSFAKHFVNDPNELVLTSLRGIAATNTQVELDEVNKIIYRKPTEDTRNNVSIISGGGAGHEPSFAGYVGEGMLTAAVSGSIFASPSPPQIFNAISKRVESKNGVLLIVMNYTGDVLNFGLAMEKARAVGIEVEMVVVGDDVGVGREKSGKVGRRGLAGTVLVQKIVGAVAQRGYGLEACKTLGDFVANQIVSVGASLAHVHVPGREESQDKLGNNEIEVGMGIHNEQGSKRVETPALPDLIGHLLELLLDKNDEDRAYLDWDEDSGFVLMVNNLGGVSPLEMGAIANETIKQLHTLYAIDPKLVYHGAFMTSLNGLGFSLSLLKYNARELRSSHNLLEHLQYPVRIPSWPAYASSAQRPGLVSQQPPLHYEGPPQPSGLLLDVRAFSRALAAACERVKAAERIITQYDEQVGDGDCGVSLARGADAILNLIQNGQIDKDTVITAVRMADAIEKNMDGTSGAIYCIFTNALANALREQARVGKTVADIGVWSVAASDALRTLERYTPARPGDRTLIDSLRPFIVTFARAKDIKAAAQAAREGAEKTRGMLPRLGRTVYVNNVGDVPDPGAVGVTEFVEGLASAFE